MEIRVQVGQSFGSIVSRLRILLLTPIFNVVVFVYYVLVSVVISCTLAVL